VEPQEFGKLASILRILVDAKLDVFAERLVELIEVVFVLSDLSEQIKRLLDDILADHFEDLVLLEGLS
jgi:hypothetical protein